MHKYSLTPIQAEKAIKACELFELFLDAVGDLRNLKIDSSPQLRLVDSPAEKTAGDQ